MQYAQTLQSPKRYSFRPIPRNPVPMSIAQRTGPLSGLSGCSAMLLADAENLIYSAANLGYSLSFVRLAELLRQASRRCTLHTFLSTPPQGHDARIEPFEQSGWVIHTNPIHEVKTRNGSRLRANSDNFLLFSAGRLLSKHRVDKVIIGSGDGDLSDDLARAVSELDTKPLVLTMSLAGSTSHRLNAVHNPRIAGNIEVGLDCLYPTHRIC